MKKKILLIDNYDSFVYNIVHLIEQLEYDVRVVRNDKISIEEVGEYDKIILSPGPGIPSEAGITCEVIRRYGATKSILGVCLGHQAIGEVYGAELINMSTVYHGVESLAEQIVDDEPLFNGVDKKFVVGRYHSWNVSNQNFPDHLRVTAIDCEEGSIMALSHRTYDVRGVQFHPESVLTPDGETMIKNWLTL